MTIRRWQAANGQSVADEHSPVTMPVAFRSAQLDQRHQRDGAIRAAAGRIEVDRALTAGLDAEQPIGQLGFAIGQIADDRDFNRSSSSSWRSAHLLKTLCSPSVHLKRCRAFEGPSRTV